MTAEALEAGVGRARGPTGSAGGGDQLGPPLREFWRWLVELGGSPSLGEIEIDPRAVVAGGKSLLAPGVQIRLWSKVAYPRAQRWIGDAEVMVAGWRPPPPTLIRVGSELLCRAGSHRVLLARHLGWSRLLAVVLSAPFDADQRIDRVRPFFSWSDEPPYPARTQPGPPSPEELAAVGQVWCALAEAHGVALHQPLETGPGGLARLGAEALVAILAARLGRSRVGGWPIPALARAIARRLAAARGLEEVLWPLGGAAGELDGAAEVPVDPTPVEEALTESGAAALPELWQALAGMADVGRRLASRPAAESTAPPPWDRWRPGHPSGAAAATGDRAPGRRCETCRWLREGRGETWRCKRAQRSRDAVPWVHETWPACAWWQPRIGPPAERPGADSS